MAKRGRSYRFLKIDGRLGAHDLALALGRPIGTRYATDAEQARRRALAAQLQEELNKPLTDAR